MKKAVAILLLVFTLAVYIICSYQQFFITVVNWREASANILLRSEKLRYGDLFGVSFLPKYKIPLEPYSLQKTVSSKRAIDLYIIGDSYLTKKIGPDNFQNIDKLIYSRWEVDDLPVRLDTLKNNILIIETAERFFLDRFQDEKGFDYPLHPESTNYFKKRSSVNTFKTLFFTKKINRNLNALLTDNYFLCLAKEIRAQFNQRIFNKIDPSVVISTDKKFLFLSETIDTNLNSSSFRKLSDENLNNAIANCNTYVNHYKKLGFKKIIVSIIPNTASIVGYENYKYNLLIPRIDTNPNRTFNFLNVYNQFRESPTPVYFNSDSHWNSNGLQLWVDDINELLN